ncbi:TPA: hypothetical protein NJ626_000267 [Vibrio parahaemolyticus]|uniref:hypothetical protein n=1 Tax=Vibrio parahaemolyticus TaxID=670 RepID=UPI00301DDC95|nr:hypothetical protein [Vibrio parahaemolyticus]HCM1516440.1 hypothetical protein [Vibrio parahaemolyticus]
MKISFILERVLKFVVNALLNEAAREVTKALRDEEKALDLESKVTEARQRAEKRVSEAARVEGLAKKLKELHD